MAIKIYGVPKSGSVRRVGLAAKILGVEYELVPVDVPGHEHKTPAFLEKHAFGQIPYIEDGDFRMFESRAIAKYLFAKYGKDHPLVPTVANSTPEVYALYEQALSIENNDFEPFTFGITEEKVFRVWHGEQTDEAHVAELTKELGVRLEGYERILSKQKYLAGDQLTLADLFHLPYGNWMAVLGVPFLEDAERFPNVARWWKEINAFPEWLLVKDGIVPS